MPVRRRGIPWGHVSSGCIFSGAKVTLNGQTRAEKDLTRPELRTRWSNKSPAAIHGFTETDTPNFSFRDPPCSFYSGTKALGEEADSPAVGQSYIWRLRIPFDEFDNARNYLSKVQRYAKVYDNVNSISHRGGFCAGVPGFVGTPRALRHLQRDQSGFCHDAAGGGPDRKDSETGRNDSSFGQNDEEFYTVAAKTPRSNCVLDVSKAAGHWRQNPPGDRSLEDSLRNWKPE